MSIDDKQLMAATLLTFEKPKILTLGKTNTKIILKKLEGEKPPLSVFINEQSWFLFEKAEAYL